MLTEHTAALRILMNDDLYLLQQDILKENIVEETLQVLILEKAVPEFSFIGNNQKNFLILTNEALQENHLKALESTLLRKQLNLDDVAIVDYSAYNSSTFEQLNAFFMPQKLVCFGLKPEILHLPENAINQVNVYAACKILFTYSFTEMLGDKEKTKAFWEPMKNL